MNCAVCGEHLPTEAMFCPKCGERAKQSSREDISPPSSANAAEKFKQGMSSKLIDTTATGDQETLLWQGSYSPQAMLGGWFLSLIITLAAFTAAAFLHYGGVQWMVAVGISAAVWLGHVWMLVYQRLSHDYKLTTQRFIHGFGVLGRVTDRVEVIDIDDVQVTQGFFERMVGVGTIRILSSDITSPVTTLYGIGDVVRISTLIDDTRRAERRKRSVNIESI